MEQTLSHTIKRYSTLLTDKISVLPIAILMPHSACNCRCVMCDIWKGNKTAQQLTMTDVETVLASFEKLGTKRVVMSGGEALLNRNFFTFCEMMHTHGLRITLLSTGLTIGRHAAEICKLVDELILSLDGDAKKHNEIRNIKGAYAEMKQGVAAVRKINPDFPISARSVIHRLNYNVWDKIIDSAREIGFDRLSFLPADVTSSAFNRTDPWEKERREDVLVPLAELPALEKKLETILTRYAPLINSRFISESPEKLRKIHQYYAAHYGLASFPYKKCNAPWVSTVIEADGSVRPCFFHDVIGSIKDAPLETILNNSGSVSYRKQLNVETNNTCQKCVCYLNLQPRNRHY